jgi:hypothetical protein
MPRRKLALDDVLALKQPVHGPVEVVLIGPGDVQILGQGAGVPPACRCQLGVRRHDAGRDHGHHQVGLATRPRTEQRGDIEPAHGAQHRLDVAVRARGDDLEALAERHEGFAAQRAAYQLDDGIGQVREVAQGLVLDLAVLAEGAAQQMAGVDAALVLALRGDDVNGSASAGHGHNI